MFCRLDPATEFCPEKTGVIFCAGPPVTLVSYQKVATVSAKHQLLSTMLVRKQEEKSGLHIHVLNGGNQLLFVEYIENLKMINY